MVTLNNGIEMPILGIGTFRLSNEQAENSVYWALRDGYRLIDTARIYGNEQGVGRGIQRAIDEGLVTREEIFVTTKMWTDDYDNGAEAIDRWPRASLPPLTTNTPPSRRGTGGAGWSFSPRAAFKSVRRCWT